MPTDADAAYLALCARDARFDGRLFVGVTSTGVYCRPVCRVRTPRRENCRFFDTRAQAEAAAFRPCLKCRPEIAPGLSQMDSSHALATSAAALIDHAVHHGQPLALPGLATRLGVTDRHLRRIFQAAHGVPPRDYLATQRLLLAKQLLTDTRLPVTQVALASGFESLRRFNAAFLERYRLNPSQLRRAGAQPAGGTGQPWPAGQGAAAAAAGQAGQQARRRTRAQAARHATAQAPGAAPGLRLAWRPPCDVEGLLGHFQRRVVPGMEAVHGRTLRRTIAWRHGSTPLLGWLQLELLPDRCELRLSTSESLAPALGGLLQRVRHALDLDADPAQVDAVLARLPLPPRPGLRLPGAFDGFEAAVRVVLGQQVTVAAARTLVQRLVQQHGTPLATPFSDLHLVFPDAAIIAAADPAALGRLGIVRQRVRALQALATEVATGRLLLERGAPLLPTLQALQALPGIGEWTAQVIAMRALAWPDAWPASDIGLLNALAPHLPQSDGNGAPSRTQLVRQLTTLAEAWRPWRAYAVMRLWHFIETRE